MTEPQSCPYVDDADIEQRYLARTLTETEAEDFERHYFECDSCFARVRRATEIKSALQQSPTAPRLVPRQIARGRRSFIAGIATLAAAAVALFIVVPFRHARNNASEATPASTSPVDATRGSNLSFQVTSRATSDALTAAWNKPARATSYRVRLLAADGTLIFERETADTSIVLPPDSARVAGQNNSPYWEIQALDELRNVIATSALTPAKAARDSS
jgi:hypothetical protein